MTTFLDVWDNEKTCNFRVIFREAGISEQTVHKFASLFWSSAMLARDELDEEIRQAYAEENNVRPE